jgi:protein-tyrosine phosphatase
MFCIGSNNSKKQKNILMIVYKGYLTALAIVLTACVSAPPTHPSRLDLSGARNFRDLGGYPTTDGHRIKKGLLYRSDNLSELSDEDLEALSKLNLKRIYDLRNEDEQLADPDMLPAGHSIELVAVPFAFAALDESTMRKRILGGKLNKGDTEKLMIESYRTYAMDYRKQIAQIVRGLAEPDGLPALIHCVHGKDRTGLAVSAVLEILGVDEDIIMQDYLLSNSFWESETERLSLLAHIASFFRTPTSEVRSLMEARPEYLEAARAAAKEHYGSTENYIHEGLGLDDATIQRLRDALLG